jgi:hypothetical protein
VLDNEELDESAWRNKNEMKVPGETRMRCKDTKGFK